MPEDRRQPRAAAAKVLLVVAALSLLWAVILVAAGGIDVNVLGQRIRSNEPMRPFTIGAIALAIFVLLDGAVRAHRVWTRVTTRFDDGPIAAGLSIFVLIVGVAYSSTTAAGSDSYGYVSQADLWVKGDLHVPQPWISRVPWPDKAWSFTPLGYRPLDDAHQEILVPTYSPGLPLLMAAASVVAGRAAMFWIVPISAALLVYFTYGIGQRIGARRAGLIGAWFVTTSPVVLYMTMVPMTDVPVAAAWSAAIFFAIGTTWRSAVAAGLAAGIAVLIRPNLVPLAGVLPLLFLLRDWRRGIGRLIVYGAGAAIGVGATLAINRQVYGSPFVSGYGDVSDYFGWKNVLPNIRLYAGWLADAQTPLVFAGILALFVPLRRFWPDVPHRSPFIVFALFVLALWGMYFSYLQFEFWTYLRFLLPSWPLIMVAMGALAMFLAGVASPARVLAIAGAVLYLGAYEYRGAAHRGTFNVWKNERASILVAHRAREVTEPGSVILSMSHSGSLRYYAGRMTLRYDLLDAAWLDRGIQWLVQQGVHPYLLVDDWELPRFTERFQKQQSAALANARPMFTYEGEGRTFLFDLLPRNVSDEVIVRLSDAAGTLRSVSPSEPPRFLDQ